MAGKQRASRLMSFGATLAGGVVFGKELLKNVTVGYHHTHHTQS